MCSKLRNGYNYDSFDRFGDDLIELLLSYLSIDQKFRYECISKRIQSLILKRHQKLFIGFRFATFHNKKLFIRLSEKLYKNIECVENLIINYGLNNTIIEFLNSKGKATPQTLLCFDLIGDRRNWISNNGDYNVINKIYSSSRRVIVHDCRDLSEINAQLLGKLDVISFSIASNPVFMEIPVIEKVKSFADIYGQQIKKIKINIKGFLTISELQECLAQISRFPDLQTLFINICLNQKIISINTGLETIVNNCKKLEILKIRDNQEMSQKLVDENLFQMIGSLHELKHIEVKVITPVCAHLSSLQKCEQLTQLILNLSLIIDQTFSNIDLFFPNLKYLILNCNLLVIDYEGFENISKIKTMKIISILNDCLPENKFNSIKQNLTKISQRYPNVQYFWKFTSDQPFFPSKLNLIVSHLKPPIIELSKALRPILN